MLRTLHRRKSCSQTSVQVIPRVNDFVTSRLYLFGCILHSKLGFQSQNFLCEPIGCAALWCYGYLWGEAFSSSLKASKIEPREFPVQQILINFGKSLLFVIVSQADIAP